MPHSTSDNSCARPRRSALVGRCSSESERFLLPAADSTTSARRDPTTKVSRDRHGDCGTRTSGRTRDRIPASPAPGRPVCRNFFAYLSAPAHVDPHQFRQVQHGCTSSTASTAASVCRSKPACTRTVRPCPRIISTPPSASAAPKHLLAGPTTCTGRNEGVAPCRGDTRLDERDVGVAGRDWNCAPSTAPDTRLPVR